MRNGNMIKTDIATNLINEIEHLLGQANELCNSVVMNNTLIQSRLILLKLQELIVDTDNDQLMKAFIEFCASFDKYSDEAFIIINEPLFRDYDNFNNRFKEFISASKELRISL
jgi:hypothetical protein